MRGGSGVFVGYSKSSSFDEACPFLIGQLALEGSACRYEAKRLRGAALGDNPKLGGLTFGGSEASKVDGDLASLRINDSRQAELTVLTL